MNGHTVVATGASSWRRHFVVVVVVAMMMMLGIDQRPHTSTVVTARRSTRIMATTTTIRAAAWIPSSSKWHPRDLSSCNRIRRNDRLVFAPKTGREQRAAGIFGAGGGLQRVVLVLRLSSTMQQAQDNGIIDAAERGGGSNTGKGGGEGESARLTKAKLLLQEFNAAPEDSINGIGGISGGGAAQLDLPPSLRSGGTSSVSSSMVTTTSTTATTSSSASSSENPQVVPDTFWRNGHLQTNNGGGGNYVTRWTRGVKVAEPLVKYNPETAAKLWFRRPTKWLVRNVQIAFPVGYWAALVVADYAFGRKDNRRARAKQLTKAISQLGPAMIKGGQALASRPDLLPAEYLEELQTLQDNVPTFSNKVALDIVERELGAAFSDVFSLVEQEPVAAASIGQVYKARLVANGDLVALKIQRPRCEEIIALDLYILRWWCGIYNGIFRLLNRDIDLQAVIDDFGELIYREMDYVAEAANAQRFNELYATGGGGTAAENVFVPKIYSDLTTSKVLTMEWVDGVRLTDAESLREYGIDVTQLVDTLVECSLRQIMENGFFHADPHAGNLLATPSKQLAFLDFGMVSYADASQRNGFLLAVVHIVNRDWHELVKVYQRLGFIPPGTDLRPIEIALEGALPDVLNSEISELNFKNVVNKLGDIMYTYPFSLPPFYIAIIRCLGVLEGLAIQVDPKARIISKAYPYVASRVLTDKGESGGELHEALRRLALTPDGRVRWDRLESLLDQAKESSSYDVTAALDMLTDYLVSPEGDALLAELSQQVVDAADRLGSETVSYLVEAGKAFTINDEVALVRAFRALQEVLAVAGQEEERPEEQQGGGGRGGGGGSGNGRLRRVRQKVGEDLRNVLPNPTPSMQRLNRILELLLDHNNNNNNNSDASRSGNKNRNSNNNNAAGADPAKLVPIVRKLAQEPAIRRTVNEIMARIGERMLSRGLRVAFGLPPPRFSTPSKASTVTEDDHYSSNNNI